MNGYDAVDRALLVALAADPRATVVALADQRTHPTASRTYHGLCASE